jgi:branched-chain amino acid transport system ATP-binding protein
MLLEIRNVDISYGESRVVLNVSLNVANEEIVALLGRNGSGKSTLLKGIIGLNSVTNGSIKLDGKEITKTSVPNRSQMGVGYIPEGRGLFSTLTVMENLQVAAFATKSKHEIQTVLDLFPELRRYLEKNAMNISGGEQQMLAIARGLIGNKKILLVDEPLQGLAPFIVSRILAKMKEIKKSSSILLVEQNANKALEVADRVYIMKEGRILCETTPDEVFNDEKLQGLLAIA